MPAGGEQLLVDIEVRVNGELSLRSIEHSFQPVELVSVKYSISENQLINIHEATIIC